MDPHEIRRLATFEMQHGDIDEDEFRELERREAEGATPPGCKSDYSRSVFRDPMGGRLSSIHTRLTR